MKLEYGSNVHERRVNDTASDIYFFVGHDPLYWTRE